MSTGPDTGAGPDICSHSPPRVYVDTCEGVPYLKFYISEIKISGFYFFEHVTRVALLEGPKGKSLSRTRVRIWEIMSGSISTNVIK